MIIEPQDLSLMHSPPPLSFFLLAGLGDRTVKFAPERPSPPLVSLEDERSTPGLIGPLRDEYQKRRSQRNGK